MSDLEKLAFLLTAKGGVLLSDPEEGFIFTFAFGRWARPTLSELIQVVYAAC